MAFIGGYHTEIALMARAARDRGYAVQLVAPACRPRILASLPGPRPRERSSRQPDPRRRAEAAPVVERFRASGYEPQFYTLYAYGAVQVWAQAAEKAGSLELHGDDRITAGTPVRHRAGPDRLRREGDLAVQNPVWYVWRGGTYVPLE